MRAASYAIALTSTLLTSGISLDVGFSGGAVLQRGVSVAVWGNETQPNAKVTVLLDGEAVGTATADGEGRWESTLPPQTTSWGRTLSARDESDGQADSAVVRFGEVVLCSGQSNMQMPVNHYEDGGFSAYNGTAEAAAAGRYTDRIKLRTLQPPFPRPTLAPWNYSAWNDVLPGPNGTVHGFSAVCWYTGKFMYERLGERVPVGLMVGSVGGSPIEAWISNASIAACGGDSPSCDNHGRVYDGAFYDQLIAPFEPYTLGTVVWDQGERDVHCFAPVGNHTAQYPCLERQLVNSWRSSFKSDFVFVTVQLPGYIGDCDSTFANPDATYYNCVPGVFNMRLAQDTGVEGVADTATVPTYDLGCPFGVKTGPCPFGSVHNVKKTRIGDRIAQQALRLRGLLPSGSVTTGPRAVEASATSSGSGTWDISVRFEGGSAPLYTNGTQYCAACCSGSVGDFDVSADGGRTYVNGTVARVTGGMTIRFSAKLPSAPNRVRFTANQGFPQCGIYNAEGFPAYPFALNVKQ